MYTKKAIISVINDLSTDQRVDRTARVLVDLGFEVVLVGRHRYNSLRLKPRIYQTNRMRLLWEKGFLFYAEFNIRLFFFLLFNKADLLVSNDLDTLLPNYLISKIKKLPLVYDSHEFYTETPELTGRLFVKRIWKFLEKKIIPHLNDCITISQSISSLYYELYGISFQVIRNISEPIDSNIVRTIQESELSEKRKYIILQGAGINMDRGAEEAVMAMKYLENITLLIVGDGDVLPELHRITEKMALENKVKFIGKQSPADLYIYTSISCIGLSLDKDTNINYRFSLPNKLFDYIRAGIPILASPLPEVKNIIEQFQIGCFIHSYEPEHIALKIKEMLADEVQYNKWKENLKVAGSSLTWENEKPLLVDIFKKYA